MTPARLESVLASYWARGPNDEPGWRQQMLWLIEPLEETGLLSAAEAALWRDRFQQTGALGTVSREVRQDAIALLDSLLAAVPDNAVIGDEAHDRVNGAFAAVNDLGLLDDADRMSFMGRVGAAFGTSLPTAAEQEQMQQLRARMALGAGVTAKQPVAVLLGPDETKAGVRIMTVEVYDDGLTVVWQFRTTENQPRLGGLDSPLSLSDDARTGYSAPIAGSASLIGEDPPIRIYGGRDTFGPAPPHAATRLDVRWHDNTFRISL